MRVLRAIYRIDFPRNFDLMDNPGSVARILHEHPSEGFFDVYGEDRNARKAIAKRLIKEPLKFRSLTAEPTTFVADLETHKGIEIRDLAEDEDFRTLCACMSELLKKFKISKFERAGFRVFTFGANFKSRPHAVNAFESLIRDDLRSVIAETLGGVTDVGLAVDGKSEANLEYHLKVGPITSGQEMRKYLGEMGELFPADERLDTVIDLDIYESKFAYTAASALKWCIPSIETAAQLAKRTLGAITQGR